MGASRSIRVLALMEAASVTGPAKNLLAFCQWIRSPEALARGLDIAISIGTYSRDRDDGKNNGFIQAARSIGVPIHVMAERYRFDRGVLPQIRDLILDLKPDVVQTHNVKSHFLFRISSVRRSAAWLAFQHGYVDTDLKMRLYNQLDRYSLRAADRVITVCGAFIPELVAFGVDRCRVRVLHNSTKTPVATPVSEGRQLRAQLGIEDERLLLTVGRFSKEKGHADYLNALKLLRDADSVPAWKAVLVGDGPERENLERQAAQLGIADRVVFAGFQTNVSPYYALADVFVLPSHSEGSPNVLLEAMLNRVPVAATRAGGIPEIVSDGETALLAPVENAGAIKTAVERILLDGALRNRIVAAAYQRVNEVFSPDRYRQTLVRIYLDALGMQDPGC